MEEKTLELSKGEVLFYEGQTSKDLYIVRSGIVKIYKEAGGKKLPIALVHPGQFIGELSFFDSKPRSATAEAATDLTLLKLDQERLEEEIKKIPSWFLVMLRSAAERIRGANELITRNQIVDTKIEEEFRKLEGTE